VKLYLAGKVTGDPDYKYKFYNAAMWLRVAGYCVCNPAECGLENSTWIDAMRYLIPKILECDAIALLPGWWKSKGARLEVYIAIKLHIPCRSVRTWLKRN
jgi:hypothetical protein